jgi:hypothetical protein
LVEYDDTGEEAHVSRPVVVSLPDNVGRVVVCVCRMEMVRVRAEPSQRRASKVEPSDYSQRGRLAPVFSVQVPAAQSSREHQLGSTGAMMGVASAGEPVTLQSKAVMSIGEREVRSRGDQLYKSIAYRSFQFRCWRARLSFRREVSQRRSQKGEAPSLDLHHPQMHFSPVQGGIRSGISNVVTFCLTHSWLTEKMARLSIVTWKGRGQRGVLKSRA